MLEPNAGGRAVKLAKVTGTDVAWGPEFSEGKDESMALDVAVSGARAAVAWDDLTENGKVSALCSSRPSTSRPSAASPRRASPPAPRSTPTRRASSPGPAASGSAGSRAATPSPRRSRRARTRTRTRAKRRRRRSPPRTPNSEEVDTDTPAGEEIKHGRVEVVPLDKSARRRRSARGHAEGRQRPGVRHEARRGRRRARRVSRRRHADRLERRPPRLGVGEGRRRDRAGILTRTRFPRSAPRPTILPGWLALSGLDGRTYLAALAPTGELLEPLEISRCSATVSRARRRTGRSSSRGRPGSRCASRRSSALRRRPGKPGRLAGLSVEEAEAFDSMTSRTLASGVDAGWSMQRLGRAATGANTSCWAR